MRFPDSQLLKMLTFTLLSISALIFHLLVSHIKRLNARRLLLLRKMEFLIQVIHEQEVKRFEHRREITILRQQRKQFSDRHSRIKTAFKEELERLEAIKWKQDEIAQNIRSVKLITAQTVTLVNRARILHMT